MTNRRARVAEFLGLPAISSRISERRERSGDVVFSVIAVIVVFGSLLGIVVIQTFIVQNRVQLDAVNSELSVAREHNQHLRLAVIELESPERILDTAVSRLGMIRPTERTYLPGVDPDLVSIRTPPAGNPFGPAPLPASLDPSAVVEDTP